MLGSRLSRALALLAFHAAAGLANSASAGPGILGLPEPLAAHYPASGLDRTAVHLDRYRPHPAVARIVVPEGNTAVSYGSGTLVDVRDKFGLVVTNWHVVRDGTGEVEVIFPDGFRSKARPLKVDSDWDLAALVIWRPLVQPVKLADHAPQPGDQLTICGYGSGQYRAATGRCTQYYAPAMNLPQHMVELDVEARQGDSGGPIFNDRGELAGVLFGAGQGTTLGSFGGRVESFLASLAPDIGRTPNSAIAMTEDQPAPAVEPVASTLTNNSQTPTAVIAAPVALGAQTAATKASAHHTQVKAVEPASQAETPEPKRRESSDWRAVAAPSPHPQPTLATPVPAASRGLFAYVKNALAVIGSLAIVLQAIRLAR